MEKARSIFIKYGVYVMVCVLPLLFFGNRLYPHISSKTFFFYGAVELLLVVWIYTGIVDRSYRLSKKTLWYFVPVTIFIVWITISGIFATNSTLAFWSSLGRGTGILTFYHALGFAVIIASLVKKEGMSFVYGLLKWFFLGAVILAGSIWFGVDGFGISSKALSYDRGGGLMGNSTLAAAYLMFALASAIILLSSKNISRFVKWFIGIGLMVIIFSPVFINVPGLSQDLGVMGTARGVMLGVAVSILVGLLIYFVLSHKRIIRWVGVIFSIISICLFVVSWNRLVTPGTYFHEKFAEVARGSRFIFWDAAQEAMQNKPMLGYGPENYSIVFQKYFDPKILLVENSVEGWSDRPHNIYYELGVSGGYPAIILYGGFLISILTAGYVAYRKNLINRLTISVLGGLVVGYTFQNLFSFDSLVSIVSLFSVAGIIYALLDISKVDDSKRSNCNSYYKFILIGTLSTLFIVSWYFFAFLPSKKAKLFADVFRQQPALRSSQYEKLLKGHSVGNDWDASGLGFEVYRSVADNPLSIKSSSDKLIPAIQDTAALINYFEALAENNKTDYRLYITTAYLYGSLSYLTSNPHSSEIVEHAMDIIEQAKLLNPRNPNVYWVTAQFEVWEGDFKAAEQAYRDAIALEPELPASHRLFIGFADAIGDKRLYAEALADAKRYIPGFSMEQ